MNILQFDSIQNFQGAGSASADEVEIWFSDEQSRSKAVPSNQNSQNYLVLCSSTPASNLKPFSILRPGPKTFCLFLFADVSNGCMAQEKNNLSPWITFSKTRSMPHCWDTSDQFQSVFAPVIPNPSAAYQFVGSTR